MCECVFVCRMGKMSDGQNVQEVLRRNLTNSKQTEKLIICDFVQI
jgi:hypothetical protein